MKISIITVCKNAGKNIKDTLMSVASQSYPNIEHIIIDGMSSDGTIAIIKNHELRIKNCELRKKITFRWISEKDNGIYDAMNKGIQWAKGHVIYFLNAGDVFIDSDVVNRIAACFFKQPADIIVGNSLIIRPATGQARYERYPHVSKAYLFFDTINHQAIFAKRTVFSKYKGFNTDYYIMADYDWQLRMIEKDLTIRYVDTPIAVYRNNGVSSPDNRRTYILHQKERNMIIKNHFSPAERLWYNALLPFDYLYRKIYLNA